jgi:hypothetical protein
MTIAAEMRPSESPPWGDPVQWVEIHLRIERTLRCANGRREGLRRLAKTIADEIAAVSSPMADVAAATCPWCPDPCCLKARVWFDLKDLLVMKLTGRPAPRSQAIAHLNDRCRYIGARGCRLDRCNRPWICTWYLCPTQKNRLRSDDRKRWVQLTERLCAISAARKALASEFLQAAVS